MAAAAKPAPECAICCEKFNGSTRKPVACGCEHVACRECTQRYLLESPNDPDCMSCRRRWTPAFIHENFTQVFANTKLRAHREDVLFDREKSMLPATQELAEARKKANVLTEKNRELRKRVAELKEQTNVTQSFPWYIRQFAPEERMERLKERARVKGEIAQLNAEITYNMEMIADTALFTQPRFTRPALGVLDAVPTPEAPAPAKRQFIRACPAADCRGFLSTAWKCGMCDVRVCSDCHEIKDADGASEHVCDPDAVASARLISRDSRPCPKCAASIYKIDGCDHMFCTACQTPFHWRTGEVMVRNSNPYFYEWMRNQAGRGDQPGAPNAPNAPGAPGANAACNAEWFSDYHMIAQYDRALLQYAKRDFSRDVMNHLSRLPHIISHNVHYVDGRMAPPRDNQKIRVSYLIGEIDDAKFKKMLQKSEKERNKKAEFNELFTMYNQVSADIGRKIMRAESAEEILAIIKERDELCAFVSDTAHGIGKRYNSTWFYVGESTNYAIQTERLPRKAVASRASTSAGTIFHFSDSDNDSE